MNTIDVATLQRWLEEGRPVTVLDVRSLTERTEWAILRVSMRMFIMR